MPADPQRVKELVVAALKLPDASARAAFIVQECDGDSVLRRRLEALIQAHVHSEEAPEPPLVDAPAAETATFPHVGEPGDAAEINGDSTSDPAPQPEAGTTIAGKYRLMERIGAGGMGSVWLAKQVEPVKRLVAVKLIKLGMDSRMVLARFEAERQVLALMDHPNIARVIDAGAAPDGRPFVVMELVKGAPITEFCDTRRLTLQQRLELFVPVCQAIQHAHQKGIIHRDIKPSNVLVALYDDRPVPKVIDFGVAKATGQVLTAETLDTGFGAILGTPEYMSPEQASFNNMDIDTRSDVYALGVLLYELLTGTTPVDRKSLGKAAVLEVMRIVRDVEVPRPSSKLSTMDALPSIAACRGIEPKKLTGLLRNDLDWIVLKALEKDRSRRYETANGFAADIQRYLNGEPVQAHPPSAGYRMRKLLSKNRGAVIAASVVLIALVAGVVGTAWQAIKAEQARDDESKQRRIADGNAHTAQKEAARAAKAAEIANAATARANAAFDNAVDQFVGVRIPSTYIDQQVPFGPNEREFLGTLDKHYIEEAAAPTEGRERAAALVRSGMIRSRLGDTSGMESAMAAAVKEWEAIVGAGGVQTLANRRDLGRVLDRYAALYPLRSKSNDIVAHKEAQYIRAAGHWKQLAEEVSNDAELYLAVANACQVYGDWLWYENDGAPKRETAPSHLRSLSLLREGAAALQRAIVLRPTDKSLRDLQRRRFSIIEMRAEVLRYAFLDDHSFDNVVADILIERFLAAVRAAQQFPNTEILEQGKQGVKPADGGAMVHTYESLLADDLHRLIETRSLSSRRLLLKAWTKVVEQVPEFRYGKALLLELKVNLYLSELRASGDSSVETLAATKAMIEETRRQVRDPNLVFPPGVRQWRAGSRKAQINLEGLTPEQRLLFIWAEPVTLCVWPIAQEEVLNALVAAGGSAGNTLSGQSIDAVAMLYFSVGGWIGERSSKSADDVQVAIRCFAAGSRLVKDREGQHVFWSESIQNINKCGRFVLDSGEPEQAMPMFDLSIKLLAAGKGWPIGSLVDPFAAPEEAHFGRADALSRLGRYSEAVVEYTAAREFAEKSIEFSLNGRNSGVAKDRDALRRQRAPFIFRHGAALLQIREIQQAEAMFDEVIRLRENDDRKYPNHPETHRDLFWVYYDCGLECLRAEKWSKAEILFGKAATALDEHAAKFFNVAAYKKLWEKEVSDKRRWSHQYRGMALEKLHNIAQALAEFDLASPFVAETARNLFACQRARLVALNGDPAAAVKTVDDALSKAKPTNELLYESACVYALSAAAVKTDDALKAKYVENALATLRKAVATGWNNIAHLRKDADWVSLRDRAEFKSIIAELEKQGPSGPKQVAPPSEVK